MTTDNLAACPFCGSVPERRNGSQGMIVCNTRGCPIKDCGFTDEKWNARPTPAIADAVVEKSARALAAHDWMDNQSVCPTKAEYIEEYWPAFFARAKAALTAALPHAVDAAGVYNRVAEALQGALDECDGCELNMSNYREDDVHGLNNSYVTMFGAIEEAIRALKNPTVPYTTQERCDGQRVIDWLDNPNRRQANLAFTAGLERQIAYRFEMLQEQVRGRRWGEMAYVGTHEAQKPDGSKYLLPVYIKLPNTATTSTDYQRVVDILKRCETEMRYAGWDKPNAENVAREILYRDIAKAIEVEIGGGE